MLFASSKRARSSIRTVTSLPFSDAAMRLSQSFERFATRYSVILMEMHASSVEASRRSCSRGDMLS